MTEPVTLHHLSYLIDMARPEHRRASGRRRPDAGDPTMVVHAHGCHTAMSPSEFADEIGGGGFREPLPFLDSHPAAPTRHAQLTDGVAAGLDPLVINLDPTSMQFSLAVSQEATR